MATPSASIAALAASKPNYYSVLGVSPKASVDDIRSAYHELQLQLHPDKGGNDPARSSAVSEAWAVLEHPMNRAWYDLEAGITPNTIEERQKLNNAQRRLSLKWQLEIDDEYLQKRDEQRKANGLVIIEAKYGNTIHGAPLGSFIDVVVPLQYLAAPTQLSDEHGGLAAIDWPFSEPKSRATGFYEPCVGKGFEHELYIRYRYGGVEHEVTVGDTEPFALPRAEHVIAAAVLQRRDDEAKRTADDVQRMIDVKKKRRTILYTTSIVLLASSLLIPAIWRRVRDTIIPSSSSSSSAAATAAATTITKNVH